MVELVAIIAALMGLTALSIDIMLPALPEIAETFAAGDPNDRQLVITAYLLGFAAGQLVYGPLSDSYGRRSVLVIGLAIYAVATALVFVSPDYGLFLAARALQGVGCAAPRVIAMAVVRDLFTGRQMARVMSFAMMVFIAIPALAPSIGQGLMVFGTWHWIFVFLLLAAGVLLALSLFRLPETRPLELREPPSLKFLASAGRQVVTTRQTVGYTLAIGLMFGAMMTYVSTAQQVFEEVYDLGTMFPLVFGLIAAALAAASLTNSILVRRFGMRRMSHGAIVGFMATSAVMLALSLTTLPEPPALWVFVTLHGIAFYFFGFIMPNFNALAMEPLGRIAGTGSSFVGFTTTAVGAALSSVVGRLYDDTVVPLLAGYLALSAAALVIVLVTERGQLFHPHHEHEAG
ncbi:MAG: multidrug effflux MFS transporter [Bauldia sp.]|nr:multidrug effflux MFS transporter [Bauldia sp.]